MRNLLTAIGILAALATTPWVLALLFGATLHEGDGSNWTAAIAVSAFTGLLCFAAAATASRSEPIKLPVALLGGSYRDSIPDDRESSDRQRTVVCSMTDADEHQSPDAEAPLRLPDRRRDRPALRPAERELKAFLSSVMRGTLNDARQAVVDALDGVPFLSAWAFEYTPASPEPVDDGYLRHVRDADFVIWLAGPEVTVPVINEIREALSSRRRLIIIRYGTEPRSQQCEALLAEVGLRAKYAEAADHTQLRTGIELAMGDEIVRALRGEPDMGRLALIDALGRASLARCARRWQAPGLPRDEALALAGDRSIGAPPAAVLPTDEEPVVLLSAEMGSGKSLAAERHLQEAIELLLRDGRAPGPVYLTAKQAASGLLPAAQTSCEGLGDPRLQGATVVVDGLDEAGMQLAEQLLGEAQELTAAWPSTTVLLTTRPLPQLARAPEQCSMPELDDDESARIMAIGAGEEVSFGARATLPEPVQRSVRRPLFALLYGLTRREDPTTAPRSRGDLLAFLGEQARRRAGPSGDELLRSLAIASIRRDLGPVPASSIASHHPGIDQLLASGLVAEHPGGLVLGLPVIAQWFAAQALLSGEIDVEELVQEPDDIDLWRYPLAIAVATGSFEDATALLAPVMRTIPGFAFMVIDEALGTATLEGNTAPPWRQAGSQMRDALQAVADGLGNLADLTLPVNEEGRLAPLGVDSSGEHVDYAFWMGEEEREPIFHLAGRPMFDLEPQLPTIGFAAVGRGSAWAWRWARDRFRHELGQLFRRRVLPFGADSPVAEEAVWSLTCSLANRGSLRDDPIEIAPLLERLEATVTAAEVEGAHSVIMLVNSGEIDAVNARSALRAVDARGQAWLHSPHPGPDVRPTGPGAHMIGEYYSEQRLVELVTSMYEKAIAAYEDLVEQAFGMLADRLAMHVTLPARYVGVLDPNDTLEGPRRFTPMLSGYFDPLSAGSASLVEISVRREYFSLAPDPGLIDRLRARRPGAARWINGWVGGSALRLNQRMPATAIAYTWLWRDLKHAGVVSGMRPGAGSDL